MYLSYAPTKAGDRVRLRLSWDGKLEQLRWNDSWQVTARQPSGDCQGYGFCGKFGVCDELGSPKCRCMEGFQPEDSEEWNRENWSGGCQRIKPLGCGRGADDFRELRFGKLPDFANLRQGAADDSCRRLCLTDCQCNAYAEVNGIGSSCLLWTQELVDSVHHFNGSSNNVLFLRLANSRPGKCASSISIQLTEGSDVNQLDMPLFSFGVVAFSTDQFSVENKLGQGGFGPVYKGRLPGGEEIAVKRLSKISGQGLEEFKNEISLIAKLQHRNLVRLLGYCVHDEEKMLIYEYMPNKSLDFFLFNPTKQATLGWRERLAIIEGIARGLLYLHRDSRLRVIHRDLKASNVLLDEDMNPKISDFGMARIFGGNQNEANTNRVVGTYGYMSPEYAMEGLFSVKSDVYSFGVLVLEIVSGRKNTSFRFSDHASLIAYAWELWSQGRAMEMVDSSIRESCRQEEMLRCIQVGMLCVQGDPVHRPTMAEVMLMIERDSQSLPMPRQPTFTSSTRRGSVFREVDSEGQVSVSNELTVTMVVGR
ncbi:G-type lectin S-receptor-like serine/threonine-protein kinase B120 [Linum perenne]